MFLSPSGPTTTRFQSAFLLIRASNPNNRILDCIFSACCLFLNAPHCKPNFFSAGFADVVSVFFTVSLLVLLSSVFNAIFLLSSAVVFCFISLFSVFIVLFSSACFKRAFSFAFQSCSISDKTFFCSSVKRIFFSKDCGLSSTETVRVSNALM